MREGSLEAPTRHVIDWTNPDFVDAEKLDAEMRRQFDICHGCRRCFNLCESFPHLFDLVDAEGDDELEGVSSDKFGEVVDKCTLCDMCFLTKCPYVPPHEFNIDFPHLMLRYRVAEQKKKGIGYWDKQLTETDRNGQMGTGGMSGLANWATKRGNGLTRPAMEVLTGVDKNVELPNFAAETLQAWAAKEDLTPDATAPAVGRKAVIYATCVGEYNDTAVGQAALKVLAKNGVEAKVVYPECCGMPQLEQGDIARTAGKAERVAAALKPYVDDGYDVIALVSSCALMMKFEWPLIAPHDENVKALSQASFDIAEYLVAIADNEGLADGLSPIDGGIAFHFACHARAQNIGPKGAELLRKIPETRVAIVERCSGHGGSWGTKKEHFAFAKKFAKETAKRTVKSKRTNLVSECPLAGKHLSQVMSDVEGGDAISKSVHPVQMLARSYGLIE